MVNSTIVFMVKKRGQAVRKQLPLENFFSKLFPGSLTGLMEAILYALYF